jgi:hypothetical protein
MAIQNVATVYRLLPGEGDSTIIFVIKIVLFPKRKIIKYAIIIYCLFKVCCNLIEHNEPPKMLGEITYFAAK